MPSTDFFRRSPLPAVALLALAVVFVVLRADEMPVGALMDDAAYIETARSLAEGRGAVLHVGPAVDDVALDAFPAGFPLLLAPIAVLFPESLAILRVVPLVGWLALGLAAWFVPAPGTPRGRRALVVVFVMLNPWTVAHAGRILSDLPYAALSLGGLVLLGRALAPDGRPGSRDRLLAAAGILIACSVCVRTVGLAALLAAIIHLVAAGPRRSLAPFGAGAALVLVPFQVVFGPQGSGLLPAGPLAQQIPAGLLDRGDLVVGNLAGYLAEFTAVVLPVFGAPTESLLAGGGLAALLAPFQVALGAFLAWMVLWGRRHEHVDWRSDPVPAYLLVYLLALLNFAGWPTGVQARLLIPLLPFLFDGVLARLADGKWQRLRTAFIILALAAALGHNAYRSSRPALEGRFDPGLGGSWIRAHTAPEDVVMVRMPVRQHIRLNRPVVEFEPGGDPAAVIAECGVKWIVLGPVPVFGDPLVGEMEAFLAAHPGLTRTAHRDPAGRFTIYEVTGPN